MKPSHAQVHKLFDYCSYTGILLRKDPTNKMFSQPESTYSPDGYLTVIINGKVWLVHRIIWLWCYGRMPKNLIDHINRIRDDNRLTNLRQATKSQNARNKVGLGKLGIKGISINKHTFKYAVNITHLGHSSGLGTFDDLYEAAAYRVAAEQCIDWEFFKDTSSAWEFLQEYLFIIKKRHSTVGSNVNNKTNIQAS